LLADDDTDRRGAGGLLHNRTPEKRDPLCKNDW
jgi:hypothetical protein